MKLHPGDTRVSLALHKDWEQGETAGHRLNKWAVKLIKPLVSSLYAKLSKPCPG